MATQRTGGSQQGHAGGGLLSKIAIKKKMNALANKVEGLKIILHEAEKGIIITRGTNMCMNSKIPAYKASAAANTAGTAAIAHPLKARD